MLAQNHSTLLDHIRPVYGLHIAHGLSVWGLWVRMSSKMSFSSHLWIYDFPRFSRNHWKSSKLYPYRQGTPHPAACHTHTHIPGNSGWQGTPGNVLSWVHTTSVLEKREMKGRASRWQERTAWVSASMSWVHIVFLQLDGRLTTGPQAPFWHQEF